MLEGKHILIGISGGIAAYKIPELIRYLKKAGAEVKVTTTRNALEFVTPLVLETLSGNKVYTDVFATGNDHTTEHISLPDWADLMIVAPATANSIGKMANGIADDALSTTFLAMQKPVLIAPAMNDKMLAHPAVQHNILTLNQFPHCHVLPTDDGFLACGTTGKGRMVPIEQIAEAAHTLLSEQSLAGKKMLITGGPTQEKIDPVRFISNFSSGKMSIALAEEAARRGADVTLILGPTNLKPTTNLLHPVHLLPAVSADDMYQSATHAFPQSDVAILCAAVADYRPETIAQEKIKREKTGAMTINLLPNQDIAAALGKQKQPHQRLIGFALETNDAEQHGADKLQRKRLDMIVINSLQDAGAGFGLDTNKVSFLYPDGHKKSLPLKSKQAVAADILSAMPQ